MKKQKDKPTLPYTADLIKISLNHVRQGDCGGRCGAACAGGVGAACPGRRGGGASPCAEGLQCSMEIRRCRGSPDVLPCRAAPGKPRLACRAVAAGRAAASRPRLACRAAAAAGIVVV
jgi:hypothetical protein